MYETAHIATTLFNLAVRVTTKDYLEGSAFLFVPKNVSGRIYVITARHCLKGKDDEFDPNPSEITIHFSGGKMPYHVSLQDRILYHESEDIALIIVSKTDLESLQGTIPSIDLITDNGGESQSLFYGFPKGFAGDGPIRVNTQLLPPIVDTVIRAESTLVSEQNLTEFTVEGFSGSGLCLSCLGNAYLLGIITNFEEWNRFKAVCISALNEILDKAKLPQEAAITIETDPVLMEGCKTLESNGANILNNIDSHISDITIERNELICNVASLLHQNDVVFISGIAGAGKSTFSKMLITHLSSTENYKAITFNGAQICRTSTTELLAMLNINQPIGKLLESKELLGPKVIYIDSGEKAFENNQIEVLKDLLRLPQKHPGLKIVISIRTYALIQTTFSVINELSISNKKIEIDLLTDVELAPIVAKYPRIKQLLANEKIATFVRTPFYLKQIITILGDLNVDEIDESELKKKLWEKLIRKDNPVREQLFQAIAIDRAKRLSPYVALPEQVSISPLNELLSESLILSNTDALGMIQYAPSHDIFEDWALVRYVSSLYTQSDENLQGCFVKAGNAYAVKRGFRFWLQELYRVNPNKAQKISTEIFEHAQIEENWKNEATTALLNSNVCSAFLNNNTKFLLDGNSELLIRIIHLLRTTCKIIGDKTPEPTYHDERTYLTSNSLIPVGPGWLSVIGFINEHFETLKHNQFLIAALLLDWRNGNINNSDPRNKIVLDLALKLITLFSVKYKHERDSPNDTLTKEIIRLIFRLAHAAPGEVSNFIISSFDFIKNAQTSKPETPDLYFYYLRDFHEKVIDIMLTQEASVELCEALPDLIIEIARFEWIAPPPTYNPSDIVRRGKSIVYFPDDDYSHDEREKYFGLRNSTKRDYSPESALQTPVGNLLRFHPDKGIEFIVSIINETIDHYAAHPKVKNAGIIKSIQITLNDGTKINQVGNQAIWEMYRGHSTTPDLLQCILMALENYLLSLAKEYSESSRKLLLNLIALLYKESKSIATTAIIASVSTAYPFIIQKQMMPLFSFKEAFLWDLSRCFSERHIYLPYSFDASKYKFQQERLASKNLPHRQYHLERLILQMSFYEGYCENIIALLDAYNNELITNPPEEYPHWQNVLFRMDRRNYNLMEYKDETSVGVVMEPVIPKDSKIARDMEATSLNKNEGIHIWNWCNEIIEKGNQQDNLIMSWRQYYCQSRSMQEGDAAKRDIYNAPGAMASIGIKFHWDELNTDERSWSVNTILEISSYILQEEADKLTYLSNMLASKYGIFDKKPVIEALGLLPSLSLLKEVCVKVNELSTKLLYHLPISDGINKPLFENLASNLWVHNPDVAKQNFRYLISLGCKELNRRNKEVITVEKVLANEFVEEDKYDFKKGYLNRLYLDKAFLMISEGTNIDKEGQEFILLYLDFLMKDTFSKERSDRYNEGPINFQEKFGILVLDHLDKIAAAKLFDRLISIILIEDEADFKHFTDDSYNLLNRCIRKVILEQDSNKHTERFNILWSLLEYKTYKSGRLAFLKYLLLNIDWKDIATTWDAIGVNPSLYKRTIEYLGEYNPESAIKLLAGIGFDHLFPDSVNLLLMLIQKCKRHSWILNYHAEKYIQRAFFYHGTAIILDKTLRKQFLSILDFMIHTGSSIAFIIKESISYGPKE